MITEEMLKNAAEASCKAQEQQLTAGFDPAQVHAFSPDFEEKMQQLRRKSRQARIYRLIRQTAAVLAVTIGVGTAFLRMQAGANYMGWVAREDMGLYTYEYEGRVKNPPMEYALSYIPEGYAEMSEYATDTEVVYQDGGENYLIFAYIQSPNHAKLFFRMKDAEPQKITVNGYTADYFSMVNTAGSVVWWDENDTLFYVTGFFEEETLVEIAESVVKIEK